MNRTTGSEHPKVEEKLNLSRFDAAFLSTLTLMAASLAILGSVLGALNGTLPILITILASYPYYVGVWKGIIRDSVKARIISWYFLIASLIMVIHASILTPLALAVVWGWLIGGPIGLLSQVTVFCVAPFLLLLVPLRLWDRMTDDVTQAFIARSPKRKKEVADGKVEFGFYRHVAPAAIFWGETWYIALLTNQKFWFSTGIFTKPIVTSTPTGELVGLILYLLIGLFFAISARGLRTGKRKPKQNV